MVMVGVITDKKGYVGEMLVTNLIAENINIPEDATVYIGYSENFNKPYKLQYWRSGKRNAKLRLAGVDNDEKSKSLIEMGIFAEESILKESNPETTFTHELLGLKVIDTENNQEIGFVSDLMFLPANDVLVIDCGDKYLNLPFVEEFLEDIDISKGKIFVNLPVGYEELQESKQQKWN